MHEKKIQLNRATRRQTLLGIPLRFIGQSFCASDSLWFFRMLMITISLPHRSNHLIHWKSVSGGENQKHCCHGLSQITLSNCRHLESWSTASVSLHTHSHSDLRTHLACVSAKATGCGPTLSSGAAFPARTHWGSSGGTHRSAGDEAELGFSPAAQRDAGGQGLWFTPGIKI